MKAFKKLKNVVGEIKSLCGLRSRKNIDDGLVNWDFLEPGAEVQGD